VAFAVLTGGLYEDGVPEPSPPMAAISDIDEMGDRGSAQNVDVAYRVEDLFSSPFPYDISPMPKQDGVKFDFAPATGTCSGDIATCSAIDSTESEGVREEGRFSILTRVRFTISARQLH
jgi:hypothetical protein